MLHSRITFGHNSFVLSEHFAVGGAVDKTKVHDTVVIDERDVGPMFRDTRDAYHLTTGGALGRVHRGMSLWRLQGRILVPDASQKQEMADREVALRAAFDPELCYRDSPTTDGAYALDWDELTADTANFPTGRRPARVYARPADQPLIMEDVKDRTMRRFALALVAADPRIYAQDLSSENLTPGAPSTVVTTIGTAQTPWQAIITMGGAGSATFSLNNTGDLLDAFSLNLSGMVNGDVVAVTSETSGPFGRGRRITKNAVDTFSLKVSAVDTWFEILPGAQTIEMTNHTNVTSCVFVWGNAWA